MINEDSRILITGCGGMLGDAVYSYFSGRCFVKASDIDVNEKWLTYLDVRDFRAFEKTILEYKPTVIFHLAALTDLEYCEANSSDAYDTNAVGTENAALLSKKYDLLMVYISTAGIFDGNRNVYTDFDIPNPINIYGSSKYAGEKFVASYLDRYFVFRPGWMMGGGPAKDKKFVGKIIKRINSGAKKLYAVNDKLGTPTYTYDLVHNMSEVINSGLYGIYNVACKGDGSRYDVAKEILGNLKLGNSIKLFEVTSETFEEEYFAPRPYSEKLSGLKLNVRGLNRMRDWRISLKEYLNKFEWLEREIE